MRRAGHPVAMRLRRSREPGNDPWVERGLETERLVLRRFTPADVGNLLALDGDPEVMRYLEPRVKTRAQIEAEVLPLFLGRHQPCPDFGRWAADARDSGDFVGWFGLRPVQPSDAAIVDWADAPPGSGVAELGYRLRGSAWGRGYATEAARALVRRAFTELGVREVVATTMTVNARSRAVL